MASGLVYVGQVAFIVLLFAQSVSDDAYPAKYKVNLDLYRLLVLHFLLWAYAVFIDGSLQSLFALWALSIMEFVIFVGIIFGAFKPV